MAGRRLRRDREQGMVGGVCSGIAAQFEYDVTLVRVVTVLLAFAGGFGVVAYVALWVLLPEADSTTESATAVASENVREIVDATRRAARAARGSVARDGGGDGEDGDAAAVAAGAVFSGAEERAAEPPPVPPPPVEIAAGPQPQRSARRARPSAAPFSPTPPRLPPAGPPSPSSGRARRS